MQIMQCLHGHGGSGQRKSEGAALRLFTAAQRTLSLIHI